MSLYSLLSCNNSLFWFSSVLGFFSVEESHRKNPSWMNINSGAVGNHTFFIIFGKEKIYFFLEALHPSAATHYCLPKCTKLARKQMFPITNDIYQLVSGLGLLQNWSSLEEWLWVTTGFLSTFKVKKCNGWYDYHWPSASFIYINIYICISTITFVFQIRHFYFTTNIRMPSWICLIVFHLHWYLTFWNFMFNIFIIVFSQSVILFCIVAQKLNYIVKMFMFLSSRL